MNIAITEHRKSRVRYDDLREWIVEADKLGELVRANGYTWQEDIGMAAELLQHDANAPVALFDNIPGYPNGFRVLTNFFGGRRQNMTLGFPTDLNKIELSEAFLADFQKISDKPLPYEVVQSGPEPVLVVCSTCRQPIRRNEALRISFCPIHGLSQPFTFIPLTLRRLSGA